MMVTVSRHAYRPAMVKHQDQNFLNYIDAIQGKQN